MSDTYPHLVSVVIPVYNMENFLGETIQSVLDASYSNIEIIVVDDGSTDRSVEVANGYADSYPEISILKQENKGVSAARNLGISKAKGKYILPVDADNLISKDFILQAISIISNRPEVKVVTPKAEFFGDRQGDWKLHEFSLQMLAHKNMMDTCAMFRKSDWERVGGYCEHIIAREDWDFWISMLKNGGEVVRLTDTGLYYRIRKNSKRVTDRKLKKHVIDVLNGRHKAFFVKQLGGKLRYNRSWSKTINFISSIIKSEKVVVNDTFENSEEFIYSISATFRDAGITLHQGRNTVKQFEVNEKSLVVKSFGIPNFFNRIIYGNLRKSKAERSYLYAKKLNSLSISSPEPVGFIEKKFLFFFGKSYYISLKSDCKYDFRDIERNSNFPERIKILSTIARFTARMHQNGILHTDFSAGNILFGIKSTNEYQIEVIDLNRIKFKSVGKLEGCKNFERLDADADALEILAREYANARAYDVDECTALIKQFRWKKHKN